MPLELSHLLWHRGRPGRPLGPLQSLNWGPVIRTTRLEKRGNAAAPPTWYGPTWSKHMPSCSTCIQFAGLTWNLWDWLAVSATVSVPESSSTRGGRLLKHFRVLLRGRHPLEFGSCCEVKNTNVMFYLSCPVHFCAYCCQSLKQASVRCLSIQSSSSYSKNKNKNPLIELLPPLQRTFRHIAYMDQCSASCWSTESFYVP